MANYLKTQVYQLLTCKLNKEEAITKHFEIKFNIISGKPKDMSNRIYPLINKNFN